MRINVFCRLVALAGLALSGIGWGAGHAAFAEEPALTFGFLTDTHQPSERVQKALELF